MLYILYYSLKCRHNHFCASYLVIADLLQQASSKEIVLQVCDAAYTHRDHKSIPVAVINNVCQKLNTSNTEANQAR